MTFGFFTTKRKDFYYFLEITAKYIPRSLPPKPSVISKDCPSVNFYTSQDGLVGTDCYAIQDVYDELEYGFEYFVFVF